MQTYDAFDEFQIREAQKARERAAIGQMIHFRLQQKLKMKNSTNTRLNELSEEMFYKTNTELPEDMGQALEGKAGKAGHERLKGMEKPVLMTAIKGW